MKTTAASMAKQCTAATIKFSYFCIILFSRANEAFGQTEEPKAFGLKLFAFSSSPPGCRAPRARTPIMKVMWPTGMQEMKSTANQPLDSCWPAMVLRAQARPQIRQALLLGNCPWRSFTDPFGLTNAVLKLSTMSK